MRRISYQLPNDTAAKKYRKEIRYLRLRQSTSMEFGKIPRRFCHHRYPREGAADNIFLSSSSESCPSCAREETKLNISERHRQLDRDVEERRRILRGLKEEMESLDRLCKRDSNRTDYNCRWTLLLARQLNTEAEILTIKQSKSSFASQQMAAFEQRWGLKWDAN